MVVWACFSKCSQCTLYPNGETRCDLDFRLATELCDQFTPGRAKLFNPSTEKKEEEKVLKQSVPRASFSKPRKVTTRTVKTKKNSAQGTLF